MKKESKDNIIDKFGICECMELLDEVKNFWHGNKEYDEAYSAAIDNLYSSISQPPIDFYSKAIKYYGKSTWDISECEIYANHIDINKWKNLKWDDNYSIITKFDMIDILVELLREQILLFYKNGLFESDKTFKETIVDFIIEFDNLKVKNGKEDLTYIYKNCFCQIANDLYENNILSAKNKFIAFEKELEEKEKHTDNIGESSLVKSLVKEISERR